MYAQVEKLKDNKSRAVANSVAQKKSSRTQSFRLVNNRPEAISQSKPVLMNNICQHPFSINYKVNESGLHGCSKSGINYQPTGATIIDKKMIQRQVVESVTFRRSQAFNNQNNRDAAQNYWNTLNDNAQQARTNAYNDLYDNGIPIQGLPPALQNLRNILQQNNQNQQQVSLFWGQAVEHYLNQNSPGWQRQIILENSRPDYGRTVGNGQNINLYADLTTPLEATAAGTHITGKLLASGIVPNTAAAADITYAPLGQNLDQIPQIDDLTRNALDVRERLADYHRQNNDPEHNEWAANQQVRTVAQITALTDHQKQAFIHAAQQNGFI